MTTYRAIAESETDVEAPVTAALLKAFQKNVLAIREGDASAPKIQNAAFANNTLSASKLIQDANLTTAVGYGYANLALFALGLTTIGTTGGSGGSVGTNYSGASITVTTYGVIGFGTWKCIGRYTAGTEHYLRIA